MARFEEVFTGKLRPRALKKIRFDQPPAVDLGSFDPRGCRLHGQGNLGLVLALNTRMFQQVRWVAISAILAAFGLSFYGPMATASSKIHPHAEFLKGAPNSRVTINRYAGHPDFNSQQSLSWSFGEDGLLRTGKTIYTRRQEGYIPACETLMGEQQEFALSKMVFTNYLQESDIPKYIKLGESFDTGQVSFAIRSRDISYQKSQEIDGEKAYKFINHLIQDHDSDMVPRITATMWTVAGQKFDAFSQRIQPMPLPWQKDPDRKQLAAEFDRKKFPVVFEWGRTAQDVPREAEPLGAILAALNYQETKAMGYKLEDAWVMFHSFDEVNTRAYSLRFPNRLYPPGWTNKSDALFLVPLADAIRAFPPSKHSAKLHGLVEHGKLDETKAMDFLMEFNRKQFTLLDIRSNGNASFFPYLPRPLALRDVSDSIFQRWYMMIQRYGVEDVESAREFADHLLTLRPVLPNWNSGQFTDLADMDFSVHALTPRNAIEISNLDRAAAELDQTYVPRMLFAAFIWYMKSLSDRPLDQRSADSVLHKLHAHKVHVAMTTFDPALMKIIRKLSPLSEVKHRYEAPQGFKTPDFRGQEWLSMGYTNEPITFFFSVEQMVALANRWPRIYEDAYHAAEERNWARHLMLTNPDMF